VALVQQDSSSVNRKRLFVLAAALQLACGAALVIDLLSELDESLLHLSIEGLAVVALFVGAAITISGLFRLVQRNEAVEEQLEAATGAFNDVLESHFFRWGLSPSERDVAILLIKGLSTAEIAELRNTRNGTVKAQNAAIYRKAGVSGRAELLGVFIDEIVAGIATSDGRVPAN